MARPDVKIQRRQQILDAFEICVARYGVEGATLAKTAEQARLARALIRHNVGNREDLIAALTDRYREKSRVGLQDMIAALPDQTPTRSLVDILFDQSLSDPQLVRVANALIAASPHDATLAGQMRGCMDKFVTALERVISEEFQGASASHISAVAAGITGIYFNIEACYPLGDISTLSNASKRAAMLLVASLEPTP